MAKKKIQKLPFLSKFAETTSSAWPWPATCVHNPRTPSFRANTFYSIVNSAYIIDDNKPAAEISDSFSGIDCPGESFGCASEVTDETAVVIEGLRSDRLFFEPGQTNSILEEAKMSRDFPYKETVAILALDSRDPIQDFRLSMEEMVEAHGLKDWECLEELLVCYLRVNRKDNHGYIVGAFVDLLLHLALASPSDEGPSAIDEQCCSSSSTTTHYGSFTSPLSFSASTYSSTSPCSSLLDQNLSVDINRDKCS